ncbi:MAG: phosphatidylserine decarboxylase [Elusimicrobia bacterium RIFOXYA2_FULL_39_19]|nr:MAG: phosphatidylserine decarboxylase [Elusimicrobia bacterium RIFOXYA2_FULL_39_19]
MKLPISTEGFIFIKSALLFSIAFYILNRYHWLFYLLSGVCFFLFCFFLVFFRDPDRKIIQDNKVILSPADGTVFEIEQKADFKIVKIFMSPLNVHVQRAPFSGTVKSIQYKKGAYLPAYVPKSSDLNEQNVITLSGEDFESDIKQIAGIMVRRIVCWVKEGDKVIQGQRIGMIKFGSQVDISIDKKIEVTVKPKQKVKAGLTILGKIK